MLTYGDMMSLLLCFFVMLVSMSQIKEEDRWREMLESLKKAFGYTASSNQVPGDKTPFNAKSVIDQVNEHLVRRNKDHKGSDSQTRRQQQFGKSTTVRMVREGMVFTVGGVSLFEEGTANLLPEAEAEVLGIIEPVRGYRNKISVRGHTSRAPLAPGSAYANQMDLSYARASAVSEFMIANGIDRDRLNLEACGGNEPIRLHAYDKETAAENERVEIIIKDTMVQDFEGSGKTAAPAESSATAPQQ